LPLTREKRQKIFRLDEISGSLPGKTLSTNSISNNRDLYILFPSTQKRFLSIVAVIMILIGLYSLHNAHFVYPQNLGLKSLILHH